MSVRRVISIAVLAVLFAVPISGPVCAVLCASTGHETSHHGDHGAAGNCEESALASTGAEMRGVSVHGCPAHDAIQIPAASTAPERAVTAVPLMARATPPIVTLSTPLLRLHAASGSHAPPGAPPPSIPLILRV